MILPAQWFSPPDPAAAAVHKAVRAVKGGRVGVDPLERLMDPAFTETLWYYEHSHTEPEVPGQLHVKQREALLAPSRSRFLFWGNQVGKTTVGAVDVALFALGRHPVWNDVEYCAKHGLRGHKPPVLIWASALTWDLWQEQLLPEILTWIPPERIIDAPTPRVPSMKRTILVRADDGSVSRIVGKSAEQGRKKYQSARVHHVWYDEEHPKEIRDEVQPRLLRHGGHEITTATPLLGLTWMHGDIYQPWKQGKRPDIYVSHAGLMDNPSISPDEVERMKIEYAGDEAQLAARLYGEFTQPAGLAIKFDPQLHMEVFDRDLMIKTVADQKWNQVCGIDFGHWRFSFVHGVIDRAKRCHIAGEYFSQKETLETSAIWIHEYLTEWGADRTCRIWGDSANPQDILEMNTAFQRMESPFRVRGVSKGSADSVNFVQASLGRVNNLMTRGALLWRRGLSDTAIWYRGQSAASEGTRMIGSRLLWELANFRYPAPKGDKAQVQNPDENTADGADAVSALRYLVISHYPKPELPKRREKTSQNIDTSTDEILKRVAQAHKEGRTRR